MVFVGLLLILVAVLSAEPNAGPPRTTISELLADKQQWKSKRVEIVGFHRTLPEMSAIYETKEEADLPHRNSNRGLWIDYSGSPAEVKLVKTGYVRVVGTFEFYPGRGCGHMNRWPAELRKLEKMEVLEPPKTNAVAPPAAAQGTNSLRGDHE